MHDLNHHELQWPEPDFAETGQIKAQPFRIPQNQWTNMRAIREHFKFPPGSTFKSKGGVAHRDMVTALVANDEYVCSGCSDGSIHRWNVETGEPDA